MPVDFLIHYIDYIGEGARSLFLGSSSKLYWLYCLSFIFFGIGILLYQQNKEGLPFSLKRVLISIFPIQHYRSKSFRVDLWIVVINLVFLIPLLDAFLIYFSIERADFIFFIREHLKYFKQINLAETMSLTPTQVNYLFTLGVFVSHDFAFYVAHYIQHKYAIFWEMHKVHHTAETLNPLTTYRTHPLSVLFQKGMIVALIILYIAVFKTVVSSRVIAITFLDISIFVFVYNLLALFRHSHVWVSYGILNYIFVSPAMHQAHHSGDPRHYGKNIGNILSIWDWLFSTGYFPKKREIYHCGIGESLDQYQTLKMAYIDPFVKIGIILRDKIFRFIGIIFKSFYGSRSLTARSSHSPGMDESG